MATLQKFKLLAHCAAAAASPSRSPSASPVIHLRRRKTLRMLLSRATGGGGGGRRLPPRSCAAAASSDRRESSDKRSAQDKVKEPLARNKLKDLFVSSPPPLAESVSENVREMLLPPGGEFREGGGGVRSLRPLSATFRQRLLLRRAWRPVLGGIPE